MGTKVGVGDVQSLPENELLSRVAAGGRGAFDEFYRRYHRVVYVVVVRVLIDASQSEEVAQEVFLEAWQNAGRFDSAKGRAATWITTMAYRRAVDRVRASQTSRVRDQAMAVRDYHPAFDGTYESVEVAVEFARVTEAMKRITPLQREAVDLAYRQHNSMTEIATQLGLPLGTIKSRLRDGLISLRRELADA